MSSALLTALGEEVDSIDPSIEPIGRHQITEKDYDLYLEGRASGLTSERAAKKVGFSKQAMYEYQARHPEKWEEFKGRMRAPMVEHIIRHAKKQWQPAAWFLERAFPQEFALTEVHRVQHSGVVEHKFQMVDQKTIEAMSQSVRDVDAQVCKP